MNVLEKILEEIDRLKENCLLAEFESGYAAGAVDMANAIKDVICANMGDGKGTNVPSNDDMEEKIREHIAECLHRIDNIRSFVGSKEYTNNDEKCIRNIEVLKTIITALEGYLSSKKKSGNDGWIPVEERLPDAGNGKYYPLLNVATSYGAVKCGFYRVRDKQWYIYKEIYNEFVEARDKEIVAWQYFPEPYKPK